MAVLRSIGRWKKDDEVSKCDGCSSAFGILVRRHHCRSCGGIFCNPCSSHALIIAVINPSETQRVCDSCHARLVSPAAAPRPVPEPVSVEPPIVKEHVQAACAVAEQPQSVEIDVVPPTDNMSESSMDSDDFDGPVDITSRIASALVVSSHCIASTGNLSFLSALQDGLKKVDADNVLSILIFVSPVQQHAMMVTFEPHETMGDLAARLAEFYFKLENPPFRRVTPEALDALRAKLRFTSEYQVIDPSTSATSVVTQCRNVVLSTPEVLAQQSTNTASERSLKDFWRSERSDQHEDASGW
ncbi:zinc finger protein, putative [Bodo saltans]|uniref:Zinc finger protein, putative n=1 Tax=Bodo saltans TaxID=75058 RepID=A0A0S4INI3_BODSA|nr:zinc finger protein, putative [Bodo saltans]|eukprot:CUE86164.1 zinc finger protein, putative [Bodo saltans]